ncbi:MAG: polyprenyl synthetase family protein [Acidobacteriaceae bacterium]
MLPEIARSVLDIEQLRESFEAHLPLPLDLEPRLKETLNHILQNPGSLVRPQIVFQMSIAYGLPKSSATDLAMALEYFHTASLLFDDLPCMDNAVERRGAPCVHLVSSESGAILAALGLINRAYALAWRAVSACPQEIQTRGLAYLEQHLGVEGLLNGQSLDLHYSALPHDLQTTERIAMGKTVSLIRLALVLPALLGGASESELQFLDHVARYWGLSYQILDDLKDVLQSDIEAGKTVARDIELDRPNIALTIGIPDAVQRLTRLIELGMKALRHLLVTRPAVSFLERLHNDLEYETARITRITFMDAMRREA